MMTSRLLLILEVCESVPQSTEKSPECLAPGQSLGGVLPVCSLQYKGTDFDEGWVNVTSMAVSEGSC